MKVSGFFDAIGGIILLALVAVLAAKPGIITAGGNAISGVIRSAVSPVTIR